MEPRGRSRDRTVARLGCPEGLQRREAAGQGAPTRRHPTGRDLAFDTIVTGWLLRPSFPDKTLADLVDRYLDEKLPEADPTQLVPETEGATPGQLSWFTLRVTAALRGELAESVASVLTDIELPTLLTLADMELAGRLGLAREAVGILGGAGRAGRRASPKRRTRPSAARSTSVRPSSCRRCSSKSCSCPRPARRRPGTRRMPPCWPICRTRTRTRSWTCFSSTAKPPSCGRSSSRSTHRSPRTGASARPTCRPEARPAASRAPTPTCRTSRCARRRAAASDPRSRSGSGYETLLTADYSQIEMRIMAHLSEDPGLIEAFNSGEDLHRFVGARVFGVDPQDVTLRDAHQGEGDVVRPRVRSVGVRPVQAAAHRADRGEAADDGVLPPVRRGARLPALLRASRPRSTATPRRSSVAGARSPTSPAPTGCCARTPSARRSTPPSRGARPTS